MANLLNSSRSNGIGTLREGSLHAQLKQWYRIPGDQLEVPIEGYIVDIVRESLLIEIQTQNFSALKEKLAELIESYNVLLVYPVISDKWIIYKVKGGSTIRRRLSPKHCTYHNVFNELVYIPKIFAHPNLSVEVLLVQIEEVRQKSGNKTKTSSGWSTTDKRLLNVKKGVSLRSPEDLLAQIPRDIEVPFTNAELSKKLKQSINLTQKFTYSLRKMGALQLIGKKGNAHLYCYDNST